jgi:hypothetical protein
MTTELYDQVAIITQEYLGPATDRFLIRQITNHLGKSPQELTAADIPVLVEWTKATLALLTEDREMVEEYADKLSRLAEVR